jgi:2'-5' RNA ligase
MQSKNKNQKKKFHRLFIAVEIPEELKKIVTRHHCGIQGVKWVKPEQIHLTVRFLGDTESDKLEKIKEALTEFKFTEFTFTAEDKAGFFPSPAKPSVFYLSCGNTDKLVELKYYIDTLLEECGIPAETRKFIPHITIARIKKNFNRKNCGVLQDTFSDLKTFNIRADKVTLYRSTLTSNGAVHEKIC